MRAKNSSLASYRPDMPLTDGRKFAGYTIVRLLGRAVWGKVYLAQHPRLPRRDGRLYRRRVSTASAPRLFPCSHHAVQIDKVPRHAEVLSK